MTRESNALVNGAADLFLLAAAALDANDGYDGLARVLTATDGAGSVYTYTSDLVDNRTRSG